VCVCGAMGSFYFVEAREAKLLQLGSQGRGDAVERRSTLFECALD
jgi:hypothetical protein